jgi:hypothetical protein
MVTTLTPLEVPVPSDPLSAVWTAVKIADIAGIDIPGVSNVGDIVSNITGKVFGGGGHHTGSLPDFTVPLNTPNIIDTPNRFRSYRGLGGEGGILTGQTKSINETFYPALLELEKDLLGKGRITGDPEKDVVGQFLTQFRAVAPQNSTSPSDAVRRNQQAANLASNLVTYNDLLRTAQKSFLDSHSGISQTFFNNTIEDQNSILDIWKDNQGDVGLSQSLTNTENGINNPLPTNQNTTINVSVTTPAQTSSGLAPIVQSQPQSTLGQSTGLFNPTLPSNPQTKSNWWNKLVNTGRVAGGIHTAVTLPFTVADLFRGQESEDSLFFGAPAGDEFFTFPNNDVGSANPFSFTTNNLPANGQGFTIEELLEEQEAQQSSILNSSMLPFLLIGLAVALIATRKRHA